MDDYEKELYMVQGFAAASGSGPGAPGSLLPGPPSSEFVQDGEWAKLVVGGLWGLLYNSLVKQEIVPLNEE